MRVVRPWSRPPLSIQSKGIAVKFRYHPDEEFAVPFLIQDLARLRRKLLDDAARTLGLTRTQLVTLGNLSLRNAEGITQSELAQMMDVNKVSIGATIDRLEERGYVSRQLDEEDRRVRRLHLTASGRDAAAFIKVEMAKLNPHIYDGITDRDFSILSRALERMRFNLQLVLGEQNMADAPAGE